VNVELSQEQEAFRNTTRRFLEARVPLLVVRQLYESHDGFERSWWREAAELGWTSLFGPEVGGGGISPIPTRDAVIVAEEMGRMVAPGPFLPVSVVAAALLWEGTATQRADLLPALASGDSIASWALAEPGDVWDPASFMTRAVLDGDIMVLTGTKAYVEAATTSDHFLVTARTDDGLTQALVAANADGVTVTPGRSIDMTRRFGLVTFDGTRVPTSAVLGTVAGAGPAVERQVQLAIALQCAELVGVAQRTLEFTLEYGSSRHAFGRPIVSFQALKHRIADMTVWLEGSKAVTDALAQAIDDEDPESLHLARIAKAYVGEHCPDVVDDCVQITGGIGVTWEHDIHLYNRRATLDRALYGTPEDHKEQVITWLRG
jgi:alkylation response protein AidB-like acyl-CoA dehydrogenase